jgi:FAD/FMN-containing dehydrogenase
MIHAGSEAEIGHWIVEAGCSGRRLRAHGARHSVAPAIGTGDANGIEVVLDGMGHVRVDRTDEGGHRVAVGAGVRIGRDRLARSGRASPSLVEQLGRHDLALANLGGVADQTLVGFMATGSAGGSTRHRLAQQVRRVRWVDGLGQIREATRTDPLFPFIGTSLGLLGVVTEIELDALPHYDVAGREQLLARADAPFDLTSSGQSGVYPFLERHDYARILWWPQRGAERFAIWTAKRIAAADYDQTTGPQQAFEARPYQSLPRIGGSERPAQMMAALGLRAMDATSHPRVAKTVLNLFMPAETKTFHDRWHAALPMDAEIDERVLPVEFAELWFSPSESAEALRRLDVYFQRFGPKATGCFAVELYAGAPTPFALAAGHGHAGALRINLMAYAKARRSATAHFHPFWELFEGLSPQLHWGKHLPPAPLTKRWIREAHPALDEFQEVRRELDPKNVFLSEYFRERLGITAPTRPSNGAGPTRQRPTPAETLPEQAKRPALRWPMPFELEPVSVEFRAQAQRRLEFRLDCFSDPEFLFDSFVGMHNAHAWLDQFLGVARDDDGVGSVFEEYFTFMALRGRTLEVDPPRRWVVRLEQTSAPLACRMLEEIDIVSSSSGRSSLVWTFHFDPHPLAGYLERALIPLFSRLCSHSLERLGALAERQAGIVGRRHDWGAVL